MVKRSENFKKSVFSQDEVGGNNEMGIKKQRLGLSSKPNRIRDRSERFIGELKLNLRLKIS